MNTELLAKIYKAKDARRKHLVHLPLDKKIEIIEQLRDMGIALRAARRGFAKNFVKSDVVRTCRVQIPAQNPPAFSWNLGGPEVRDCGRAPKVAGDYQDMMLAA